MDEKIYKINLKEAMKFDPLVKSTQKLTKGEKIIHIKASKRSKAHKRKVKVSDKTKEKVFNSTYLDLFENKIKSQDFESCAAFDENGNMVFNKDGEKDRVEFNNEERLKQKWTVFTHNHPIGYSFSPADIKWSCKAELKEMRCISKSGDKFIMKMKDGSNFNMKLWDEKINSWQKDINDQVHDEFINAINNKDITIQEATDAHWDEVWKRAVKKIPELEYYWGD